MSIVCSFALVRLILLRPMPFGLWIIRGCLVILRTVVAWSCGAILYAGYCAAHPDTAAFTVRMVSDGLGRFKKFRYGVYVVLVICISIAAQPTVSNVRGDYVAAPNGAGPHSYLRFVWNVSAQACFHRTVRRDRVLRRHSL